MRISDWSSDVCSSDLDSIEANFPGFANFVQRSLQFIGRQYETTVGPIDILARDKKTGGYVVIELKKGRAADKVYGQISRYMGWVKKNIAGVAPVAGMIVGRVSGESAFGKECVRRCRLR